jgi:hypothetical protein
MKAICLTIAALLLTALTYQVFSQSTTVTIPVTYDAALGYHTYFSSQANTNWSTATTNAAFVIPGATGGTNGNRALIYFNLSQIPPCVQILSAELSLYGHGPHGSLPGHSGTNNSAYIRRVTQPWNVSTVTWNNQPTATIHNQVTIPAATSVTQDYLNINVTQLVQAMVDSANFGFQLRLVNETPTNSLIFASDNFADSTKHPRLQVTYSMPCPQHIYHKVVLCDGDSILLQGAYQTKPGIYHDTLGTGSYFDTIVTTALYVEKPMVTAQMHTICQGDSIFLGGAWQKAPGIYTELHTGQNGCDSIVNHLLSIILINIHIDIDGDALTARQTGATYQWVNCATGFTPIPGATAQSFIPATPGTYAVIISYQGCVTVSDCITIGNSKVINPDGTPPYFTIIPNPANGAVTIQFTKAITEGILTVHNIAGQELQRILIKNQETLRVNPDSLGKGVMFVTLHTGGQSHTERLVIQ